MTKKKYTEIDSTAFSANFILSRTAFFLIGLTALAAPIFPDEKLQRLKLILLVSGLTLSAVVTLVRIFWMHRVQAVWSCCDLFLLLYLVVGTLFYWSSPDPAIAHTEWGRVLFCCLSFWAVKEAISAEESAHKHRMLIFAFAVSTLLISIYGIGQFWGGLGFIEIPQAKRIFSTFGNPVFLAAYLLFAIPLVLAGIWVEREKRLRIFYGFTLSAAALAFWLAQTRAAFLALGVAAVYALGMNPQCLRVVNWRYLLRKKNLVWVGLLICSNVGLWLSSSVYRKAVYALVHNNHLFSLQETHSLIWRDVLKMFIAHPILGTGFGTFVTEFPAYASAQLRAIFPESASVVNDAHNEYLQILAETGLVGLALFLLLVGSFFYQVRQFLKRSQNREEKILLTALSAGALAILVENFFSVDLRFIVSAIILFWMMGWGAALFSEERSEKIVLKNSPFLRRTVAVLLASYISGILTVGVAPLRFYVLGIWRFSAGENSGWTRTLGEGPGLIPLVLRPYLAQKVVSATPDFFEEREWEKANSLEAIQELLKKHPEEWRLWEKLGYFWAKQMQQVQSDGRKVIVAAAAERAVAAYQKAHALNSGAPGPSNNLGNIFYTLGKRQEAILWWSKAIAQNPSNLDAQFNLGLALYESGQVKAAGLQFQKVLEIDPTNEKAIVMLKRLIE